ncbi:MAG: protoheme IX farnesyltransferase [Verrucomicrobiales bacterium]|nr:protoheme IX farnesyltransferase [Verrucomicrobiales bacterium]
MKAALAAARETFTPLRTLIAVLSELAKARLTALVLITTLTGFFVARGEATTWLTGLHVMLGTALVAAGAAALNQWWERDLDRLMERTAGRPLPSGQVEPGFALGLGLVSAATGIVYLAALVNGLTALLGAAALVSYVLIYTPLKTRTTLNTLIGAVPGALPPLMGWAAARGEMGAGGVALFGVLLLWQIPHFMAIAWLYRDQYAQAGFRMMPVVDPAGRATGWWAVVCAALLIPVSVVPSVVGVAGSLYALGALSMGLAFLWTAIRFTAERERSRARLLFFASIIYLPLLLGLLMLDSALRSVA